jgi:hypothetical protein
MDTAPSPMTTLIDLLNLEQNLERKARKRAKDRERARARRAKAKADREKRNRTCRSCGNVMPKTQVQLHPGDPTVGKVQSEPCCPYCQAMVWRTRLWWFVKTQRFKMPDDTGNFFSQATV